MNQIDRGAAEHRDIDELLPWFVNGRLNDADRQRVEAHLQACRACSDELVAQRRMYQMLSAEAGVERMPTAGLNQLRRRIESLEERPAPVAPEESARAPPAGGSGARRAAIAACLGLAAVGALAASLWILHERRPDPGLYYTVTTTAPQPADTAIRAVFAPTVTLSELQQLLDEAHVKIVSGPTEAGVYSLAMAQSPSVDWSLQRLRGHDAVRFAEPVVPARVSSPAR